ncbi:MAG: UDP-N-acetylmuramate dehydrogenase [Streptococcaceae bacterium]|jgi:UDP-N-acetylmuramate dehydrogenase|nr:UDP-N-acetylmuramate dehydrogenase [Streptococcaceae bacterium]
MDLKSEFQKFPVKFDAPLSAYTFTEVGGPADVLAQPHNLEELKDLLKVARDTHTPVTILGNASNLIVRDGGIRGLVILLTKMTALTIDGNRVAAAAGCELKAVTDAAAAQALTGFEFACGIPGSVGGAVYMNAGAYGGEIREIFHSATVMTAAGVLKKLYRAEMGFGYRKSVIQTTHDVILSATFELKTGNHDAITAKMDELMAQRRAKQPLEYPSCGSVFKRPEGHFAGQLIMEAGCQGHRIGGVEVSTKHAGFMVNVAHGTAQDYETLIAWVIDKVRAHSGITLETEVRIIGEK